MRKTSPKPSETPTAALNFYDALRLAAGGSSIARKSWPAGAHGKMVDEQLVFRMADGVYHPWIVHAADIQADDWGIYLPCE